MEGVQTKTIRIICPGKVPICNISVNSFKLFTLFVEEQLFEDYSKCCSFADSAFEDEEFSVVIGFDDPFAERES